MFLHHLGDGSGHGPLLRREVRVEVDPQLLLQEVDDELGTRGLLVVVLHPGHLPLRRQLPIKVVLHREREKAEDEEMRLLLFCSLLNSSRLFGGGCLP